MGCSGSSEKPGVSAQDQASQRQKISYQIGPNVKLKGPPTVIFVFGGPGSRKGMLVADLLQTYNFRLINVETLLIAEMAGKRIRQESCTDIAERDFQQDMKEQEKISFAEVMQKIIRKIDKAPTERYLVDIMPNMRTLVSSDSISQTCGEAIIAFDLKYPISFALHFALPLEKITRKHDAKVPKMNDGQQGAAGKSDEADSTRTKKRAASFEQNVKPFLDFFRDRGRLITVDVSSGDYDSVWTKLCELFSELRVRYYGHPHTVIVVTFEGTEIDLIDFSQYQMHRLEMRDFVESTDSEEKVLTIMHQKIREKGPATTNFLVDLRFTCLARLHKFRLASDFTKKRHRSIAFVDEDAIQLEEYVAMQTNGGNPCQLEFRVISPTNNCVFLFPKTIDPALCKRIALFSPKGT